MKWQVYFLVAIITVSKIQTKDERFNENVTPEKTDPFEEEGLLEKSDSNVGTSLVLPEIPESDFVDPVAESSVETDDENKNIEEVNSDNFAKDNIEEETKEVSDEIVIQDPVIPSKILPKSSVPVKGSSIETVDEKRDNFPKDDIEEKTKEVFDEMEKNKTDSKEKNTSKSLAALPENDFLDPVAEISGEIGDKNEDNIEIKTDNFPKDNMEEETKEVFDEIVLHEPINATKILTKAPGKKEKGTVSKNTSHSPDKTKEKSNHLVNSLKEGSKILKTASKEILKTVVSQADGVQSTGHIFKTTKKPLHPIRKLSLDKNTNKLLLNLFAKQFIKNAVKKVIDKTKDPNFKPLIRLVAGNLMKNALSSKLNKILDKVDNECTREMKNLLQGFNDKQQWALAMLDSTAKISSGYLNGHLSNLGDFGECIRINYERDSKNLNGKYCAASLQPHQERGMDYYEFIYDKIRKFERMFNLTIHGKDVLNYFFESNVLHGFCVPNVCTADNLNNLTKIAEEEFQSTIHFSFYDDRCQTDENEKLSNVALACIIIFCLILSTVFVSTIYDIFVYQKAIGGSSKLLISFSLYTNGKNLLSSKVKGSDINCLNGLRVLSMLWVLFAHRYMKVMDSPMLNSFDVVKAIDTVLFSVVYSGVYAVDTFFAISGFLLVFLYLRKKSEKRPLRIPVMMFQRVIRLTPLLMVIVALEINRRFYITGPLAYRFIIPHEEACKDHWWATLLYFSNYYKPLMPCVVTGWYLGADTHLYFLSPIFLLTITKWPKVALSGLVLASIGCATCNILETYEYNLLPLLPGTEDTTQIFYYTHTRMGPWLVGAIFGYIVFKHQDAKKFKKGILLLSWFIVLFILIGLPVNIYFRVTTHVTYTTENALLNGISRSVWAFGICGLIFLCTTGQGGFIDRFLSSPIFNVGYRVNYAMYLIHMLVIDVFMARQRNIFYFEGAEIIRLVVSDYAATLVIGIILTLTVEIPFYNLGKYLYESSGKNPKAKVDNKKDVNAKVFYINAYNNHSA